MAEVKAKEAKLQVKFEDIKFKEDGKVKAMLALIFSIVGLIFLFTEKEDQFVRYYSALSVVIWIGVIILMVLFTIIGFIPVLNCLVAILAIILWPAILVFVIMGCIKINNGEKWELPMVTDYAVKLMNAV